MVQTLRIRTPKVFRPLIEPARYKGAWGGRGSGKSHFFADCTIEQAFDPGTSIVCLREVQKTLKDSAKRLIETKLREYRLGEAQGFKVYKDVIELPGDGIIIFMGMRDHTAESIKSLEGFKFAWVEESQTLSTRSLMLLRPTIREDDSELWFPWNPRSPHDPVDKLFRGGTLPSDAKVVKSNWSDNPFFPKVLEKERLDCLRMEPEKYGHIWEGEYETIGSGAYFARQIHEARMDGRIGIVGPDPLMTYGAFIDIGGTGAKSDNFVIWIAQFVGTQIRVLDHYEVAHQPIEAHLAWLRSRKYTKDNTTIWLPHDGRTFDKVYDVSYQSAFKSAGYDVEVVTNQGKGAANARIEAVRRIFPSCWFNETTTSDGVDALSWYHEKTDEKRNMGLGPEHDWASHSSDSFGLISIVYERSLKKPKVPDNPYQDFERQMYA